jgi:hypothetical protein
VCIYGAKRQVNTSPRGGMNAPPPISIPPRSTAATRSRTSWMVCSSCARASSANSPASSPIVSCEPFSAGSGSGDRRPRANSSSRRRPRTPRRPWRGPTGQRNRQIRRAAPASTDQRPVRRTACRDRGGRLRACRRSGAARSESISIFSDHGAPTVVSAVSNHQAF